MKNQPKAILPSEFLVKFANSVFIPLKNGQCVSCMFSAGGGKRMIIKYLLSEETILKKIFADQYNKTLFVYVDPDEILEISNKNYLELIYSTLIKNLKDKQIESLKNNDSNHLNAIRNTLTNAVNAGWSMVFILHDFEFTLSLSQSVFLNLETIMAINKPKIVYLFLSTINLFDETVLKSLHNLKYAIARNVVYFPLLNKIEIDFLIDQISEQTKVIIPNQIRNILFDVCGGHPQLLKYAVHNLIETGEKYLTDAKQAKSYLLSHYQLKIVCADIWNFLTQKEKDVLNNVVTTGSFLSTQHEEVEYLLKLGLINKLADDKYRVFGSLFEEFVKNKLPLKKLIFDANTKKLYYGSQSCENKFTFQEFKLLVYFVTHENELTTRDKVAEALWGKLYCDKYSDWSIDKIISIVRKKLDALGFPSEYLVTLKKRGFSFSNP